MKHFRRAQYWSVLGLWALALQFVVSFSHHHDVGGIHTGVSAGQQATLADHIECRPATADVCPPSNSDDDDADHCSICWAHAVAGAALLPAAAIIATPVLAEQPREPAEDFALKSNIRTAAFQARGPPCSLTA